MKGLGRWLLVVIVVLVDWCGRRIEFNGSEFTIGS